MKPNATKTKQPIQERFGEFLLEFRLSLWHRVFSRIDALAHQRV